MRPATLLGVALLGVGVLVVGFVFVVGATMGALPGSSSGGCGSDLSATGAAVAVRGVGGLTSSQLANADAIITEGRNRRIPVQGVGGSPAPQLPPAPPLTRGARTASSRARGGWATFLGASQESHFTNYANDG